MVKNALQKSISFQFTYPQSLPLPILLVAKHLSSVFTGDTVFFVQNHVLVQAVIAWFTRHWKVYTSCTCTFFTYLGLTMGCFKHIHPLPLVCGLEECIIYYDHVLHPDKLSGELRCGMHGTYCTQPLTPSCFSAIHPCYNYNIFPVCDYVCDHNYTCIAAFTCRFW